MKKILLFATAIALSVATIAQTAPTKAAEGKKTEVKKAEPVKKAEVKKAAAVKAEPAKKAVK